MFKLGFLFDGFKVYEYPDAVSGPYKIQVYSDPNLYCFTSSCNKSSIQVGNDYSII